MGTRIEDQPPEHWAGPESLDPTPVWKQFLLIGLFLVVGLVLVGVVAAFAVAPQIVTPPALVAGERLVLATSDVPAVGAPPKRIGAPLVEEKKSFWLARLSPTEVVAFSAHWTSPVGRDCPVIWMDRFQSSAVRWYMADCKGFSSPPIFSERGERIFGDRDLDRYLVSASGDRVIVNLSRLIVAPERTTAPRTP